MENFNFYSPTEFVFGRGRENECGIYVRKYGGSKVLLHYGSASARKSGLLDRVIASLQAEGVEYVELGGVQPNPHDTLVYQGIEICKSEKIDLILAVGGGSTIDSSKAIAMGACYDGDFWDFYSKKAKPQAALPVGTVLTIAAAGSEGSGDAVITRQDGLLKRGCTTDLIRPRFSILNPELTFSLPAWQTACGCTDIMSHTFERYFTSTEDVEVTDRLCEAILMTIIKEAPRVIANPADYDARANIMWAGMVAHNNIIGVGRIQDWSSHKLEHELSALYDCSHGAGLAVIQPAWMEYIMPQCVMRFARFATRVMGCKMDFEHPEVTAREGIDRLRRFFASIGMPVNFQQLGAREEDIPHFVETLGIGDGEIGGIVKLNAEDVANIYRIAAHTPAV